VYGISDNDRKYYSIDRAREALGYDPRDNSAEYTFAGDPIEETDHSATETNPPVDEP